MKYLLYLFPIFLVGCGSKSSTGSLKDHVKDKQHEIESAVDRFEQSGYKKISFGPPDFLTFVNSDGSSREITVNMRVVDGEPSNNDALELEAVSYVRLFRDADIRCVEKGIGLYVDFPNGGRLLICKGDAKKASQLLHGEKSVEVYPGWYTFIE